MTSNNGRAMLAAVDRDGAERAAADLLRALGADLDAEGLRETPRRMADAYAELLTPQPFHATTFPNDERLRRAGPGPRHPVPLALQHHLLPFHGVAHVGYLPGERIIGLSSWPASSSTSPATSRSRSGSRPQVADWLERELAPRGRRRGARGRAHCACRCAACRSSGAKTVTSALHGLVRDDPRTRQEFLALTSRTPS